MEKPLEDAKEPPPVAIEEIVGKAISPEPADPKGSSGGVAKKNGRKRKRQQGNKNKWSFKRQKSQQANQENCYQNRKHHQKVGKNRRVQVFPSISKFFLPDKRPRKELIVPPTKFLLGGNISDPLNLNGLQNEAINASMNAATPKSSPMTTPPKVEVIIPPNMRDPLHLLDPVDSIEYEKQLISPMKRRSKHRHRKKRKSVKKEISGCVSDTKPGTDEEYGGPAREEAALPGDEEPNHTDEAKRVSEREKAVRELKLDLTSGEGKKRKISESAGTSGASGSKVKLRRMDSMDKIVSPVIPQPGAWKRPPRPILTGPQGGPQRNRTRTYSQSTQPDESELQSPLDELQKDLPQEEHAVDETPDEPPSSSKSTEINKTPRSEEKKPKFKGKDEKFQYGNYDRYYGYRNLNEMMDVRLKVFMRNPYLFQKKDVLDIGCNVGHLTIAVAKNLNPRSIVGIDIDAKLIERARKNLSLYVRVPKSPKHPPAAAGTSQSHRKSQEFFPSSFPLCYGPVPNVVTVEKEDENKDAAPKFPRNVFFRTLNYVLKDESLLGADTQQYDLIMCLSVTKWIHLNFGDVGLKMAFKRMFNQLRPGGKLILEAQNWASYKKKKRLTVSFHIDFF
ncbi:7SK snRNA methylphosphate capping enzyme bin3 [Sergentomyia squamirostris]